MLIQYPDVSGLMDKLHQAGGSEVLAAESRALALQTDQRRQRAMVRKLILDSYDWFVGIVAERRNMTWPQALALADGSIFTGGRLSPTG